MDAAGEARGGLSRAQGARHRQWRRNPAGYAALESGGLLAQRRRNRPRHRGLRGMIMQRTVFLAITLALAAVVGSALAAPVNYKTPDEVAAFKPGPNLEVVQGNCSACHSADYINTQPRGPKFKKDFWQAEVTKMIKVYGAPIDDADAAKIVDYLAATY